MSMKLYLASSSPRRAALLRDRGWGFEQVTPPFDDSLVALGKVNPRRAAEALAYLKAASVADHLSAGIVIGCDTVLAVGEHRLGKPADRDDAARMLSLVIGHEHRAISAVALYDVATHRRDIFTDEAVVHIDPLSADDIGAYLAGEQWRGKAGGYNLAELSDRWRFTVRGDPTTVVGLPMKMLTEHLTTFAPQAISA